MWEESTHQMWGLNSASWETKSLCTVALCTVALSFNEIMAPHLQALYLFIFFYYQKQKIYLYVLIKVEEKDDERSFPQNTKTDQSNPPPYKEHYTQAHTK